MLKNKKNLILKNLNLILLIFLVVFAAVSTTLFNYKKIKDENTYNNFIDNIYLKKTLKYIVNNLDPKYKKIKHKVKSGETFDKILESYAIEKSEILKIKKSLQKKTNLNKLNTKNIIQFSLDKTINKISEFSYQVSNTQKIYLKRDIKNDVFQNELLTIKLKKQIIYKENIILDSLYQAATEQKIPANTIIEFAGIYGFQ